MRCHAHTTIYNILCEPAERLSDVASPTPVLTSRQANEKTGAQLFFKCENFQRTGSFKFRRAYYAISNLIEIEQSKGVIAFSG